jgi:two-component system OmpR family response regulator
VSNDSRVRVLVVDDEPRIANLVAMVARYEGWNAVTAGTGEAALREAATFEPDIVVLDLMLPDLEASPCSIGFGTLASLSPWCF